MTQLRQSSPRKLSKKREAQRLASEGRPAWSTIAPKNPKSAKSQKQQKPRKAIRKVNPEREAKCRKRYAQKLAAYRRSETYKVVEARAGGRCEAMDTTVIEVRAGASARVTVEPYRCYADRRYDDRLTHHHKTYARFGGHELPSDIIVLCDRHNDEAESKHPTRKRNYRPASSSPSSSPR